MQGCGQVVAEVSGAFQSDVETDQSGRVRRGGEGPQVMGHGGHDQTLEPAPTRAEAEQRETVDEPGERLFAAGSQLDG